MKGSRGLVKKASILSCEAKSSGDRSFHLSSGSYQFWRFGHKRVPFIVGSPKQWVGELLIHSDLDRDSHLVFQGGRVEFQGGFGYVRGCRVVW